MGVRTPESQPVSGYGWVGWTGAQDLLLGTVLTCEEGVSLAVWEVLYHLDLRVGVPS